MYVHIRITHTLTVCNTNEYYSHLLPRTSKTLCSICSYLQCVSQTMQKLEPFGDVPKKLSLQLRRSFVATRTFAQALAEGKRVITKIQKIPPRDKCVEALTRMTSCPACQGLPAIRPCSTYCMNVMKGCLVFHTELADSWDKFIGRL